MRATSVLSRRFCRGDRRKRAFATGQEDEQKAAALDTRVEKRAQKRACVTTEIIGIFDSARAASDCETASFSSHSLSPRPLTLCFRLFLCSPCAKYGFLRTSSQTKQTIFCGGKGSRPGGKRPLQNNARGMTLGKTRLLYREIIVIPFGRERW